MTQPTGTPLSASMEDYLEAIWACQQAHGAARVRDIAAAVGVKASAVSGALRSLAGQGLVDYQPYQYITLTEPGRQIAQTVRRRHQAVVRFLTDGLALGPEEADARACAWEHTIDADLRRRLEALTDYLDSPDRRRQWADQLRRRLDQPASPATPADSRDRPPAGRTATGATPATDAAPADPPPADAAPANPAPTDPTPADPAADRDPSAEGGLPR